MKTNRAYSTLEVKALDEEKRVITGIASTPSPDRMQDVVEPKGAQFKLPIPFLWQHNHDEPIGHVTEAKVTQKGIEVSVQLIQVDEPGRLKDRLDEAWQSIKSGLVRGLSIGFSAKEFEQIPGSWGLRFLSWEWFELSAVTIPANADATITSVKSIDREQRAALGIKAIPVVRVTPAGASATRKKSISVPKPEEGNDMKTIAEQIEELEGGRISRATEMEAIMRKSGEDGLTLDIEQSERFDSLRDEVGQIDKDLERLRILQKMQASTAKPVSEEPGAKRIQTLDMKDGLQVRAKNTQKLEPGIAFARVAKALAIGHVNHLNAIDVAKSMYDGQENIIGAVQRAVIKAAVPAGTTSHSTWAGPLVGDESSVFADFVEFLRPLTILGRFGQGTVPSLRRVPFRTRLIGQTSGGAGYWVGEGQAKPLTKFDFAGKTLEPLKVANIAVITKELLRDSSPAADVIIRDQLAAALSERQDLDFIDPAKAASAGISPASILNGIVGIPSSGIDADAVRADVKAVFSAFIAANNAPTSGVWVMDAITALSLSLMKNALGQSEFPGITMNGGIFEGLPAIVSQYVPRDSGGGIVALVNAGDIYIADDGGVDISMSTEASLQMDNAPTNNSTTPTATQLVSLWQTNSVGFLAERTVNWDRRRDSAAAYLTDVNWG